jgi:copper homeostasis protein
VRTVDIPVHALLRPHDRSFWYAIDERTDNCSTAAKLRAAGAAGIVFGALDAGGRIDLDSLAGVAASATLPLTFHRAFDATRDPYEAYAALSTLPAVTRVLTSGHAVDAWSGRDTLRALISEGTPPTVLAGGGITEHNLVSLVRITGAREVHVGGGARSGGRIDGKKVARLAALLAQLAQAPS